MPARSLCELEALGFRVGAGEPLGRGGKPIEAACIVSGIILRSMTHVLSIVGTVYHVLVRLYLRYLNFYVPHYGNNGASIVG